MWTRSWLPLLREMHSDVGRRPSAAKGLSRNNYLICDRRSQRRPDCTKGACMRPLGALASRRLSNQLGRRPGPAFLRTERATENKVGFGLPLAGIGSLALASRRPSRIRSGLRPVLLNAGETPAVPGGDAQPSCQNWDSYL